MSKKQAAAALLIAAAAGNAFAQQNAAPPTVAVVTPGETHMGVRASEHVRLGLVGRSENQSLCGYSGATFSRTLADGTSEFAVFVVPQGKALVITDISAGALANAASPWAVGQLVTIDLSTGIRVGSSIGATLWQRTVVVDAEMAAAQRLWFNERVLSGVVYGPGQVVCSLIGLGFQGGSGTVSQTTLNSLHGYLTPYTP